MKAFAVFDGGGVKGAAFSGCLKAAKDLNIDFLGFGGTSAGSIVALLCCVGYSPSELKSVMLKEVDFNKFLDDDGHTLEQLRGIKLPPNFMKFRGYPKFLWTLWANKTSLSNIVQHYGIYNGNKLKEFLHQKVMAKIPSLENKPSFTFDDLRDFPPLKIIASDLNNRAPVIYSQKENSNFPVLDAVRASVSYPIVFAPVPMLNNFLVDGGLSVNLPIHVFEDEKSRNRCPVIAFDLVEKQPIRSSTSIYLFFQDMLATALESSEHLLHKTLRGIYHVPIFIPENIKTLDFALKSADKELLFSSGYSQTQEYFSQRLPYWSQAANQIEALQAQYVPPRWIEPVLKAVADDFEQNTSAKNIRCSVMLPTLRDSRVVVYQYNMESDPDVDLELDLEAGCSGRAWIERRPVFADLTIAQEKLAEWKMPQSKQNKVPRDRASMMSIPIFDVSSTTSGLTTIVDLPLLGVLSIDSKTDLSQTGWLDGTNPWVIANAKKWSDIIGRILT